LNAEETAAAIEVQSAIRTSGIRSGDAGTVIGITKTKPVQDQMEKSSRMTNVGGAISTAGGMAGTMAAGMISSKVTDSNDTAESTIGMISTMAPMIGSMFGPWGMAIGAAVSGIGLLINGIHKTDQELLEEAQE
jgi:hypothetical protein